MPPTAAAREAIRADLALFDDEPDPDPHPRAPRAYDGSE
jgi:hypothetical protein